MFASKTPRDLVAHPDDSEFERDMTDDEWQEAGLPWVVQHNEPNPILVELRLEWDAVDVRYEVWSLTTQPDLWKDMTPEQIEHARKVLTRLARLIQINRDEDFDTPMLAAARIYDRKNG